MNEPWLEACSGRFVAVTFSAGKDSSACLHLLASVQARYGFKLGAFLFAYPKHRYTPGTLDPIEAYWRPRLDRYVVLESDIDDRIIDEAAAAGENPCRPCQDIRKRALPRIFALAGSAPAQTVIVSGHSLWDLAGYALNRFAEEELASSGSAEPGAKEDRFLEISQRFYAYLTMPEGYSVYRPMLVLNADEIESICEENSLPLLPVPCRYSQQRPKKVLGSYFERFGFSFTYDGVVEFARRFLGIPERKEIERTGRDEYLTKRF